MVDRPTIVEISGIARPSRSMRKRLTALGMMGGVHKVEDVIDREIALDGFEALLRDALTRNQKPNGEVNVREVAKHILRVMGENQK